MNAGDAHGISALHGAAEGGGLQMVERLARLGADVRARSRHGWTPLHSAALGGDLDVIDFLVVEGANARATDDRGRSPADVAAEMGHPAVALLLAGRAGVLRPER